MKKINSTLSLNINKHICRKKQNNFKIMNKQIKNNRVNIDSQEEKLRMNLQ